MKTNPAIVIALLLISIAGLSLVGCEKSTWSSGDSMPMTPEMLKSITVAEVDSQGLAKAVEKHRGKVVLVDYWATWCPACVELFPHTVDLHNRFLPADLAVITISLDKLNRSDSVLEFLRRHRADTENYQSNLDNDAEAVEAFEIPDGGLPYLRIYDRSGKIFRTISGNRPADIEKAVTEAIGESKAS